MNELKEQIIQNCKIIIENINNVKSDADLELIDTYIIPAVRRVKRS